MSYEKYCTVIDQLCQMIGLAHPRQFYETANITAYGASFSLMHGGSAVPDHLVVFCDFGPIPQDAAGVAYFEAVLALLVANLHMSAKAERGTFSINPSSGHVLFSSVLPLNGANGERVMQRLEHYAEQMKAWQAGLHGDAADAEMAHDKTTDKRQPNARVNGPGAARARQGQGQQGALMKKLMSGEK